MATFQMKLPDNALSRTAHAKLCFQAFFKTGEGRASRLASLAESHKAWAEYYKDKASYSGRIAKESHESCQTEEDVERTIRFIHQENVFTAKFQSHSRAAGRAYSKLGGALMLEGKFQEAMASFMLASVSLGKASLENKFEAAMNEYCAAKSYLEAGELEPALKKMQAAHMKLHASGYDENALKIAMEALGIMEKSPHLSRQDFCDQIAATAIEQLEYGTASRAYALAAVASQDREVASSYQETAEKCAKIHEMMSQTANYYISKYSSSSGFGTG